MGQVFQVEHIELERYFALKLMRPDRWDELLEARFRREARVLARIVSPRVAEITDFGVDEQAGPYYVMELVHGQALDSVLIQEGPLAPLRALEIARGLSQALADVHRAGLVHRDIKPANIAVCLEEPVPVKLFDFGLASSLDDSFGARLTESQRVMGSIAYMAPEQFAGDAPAFAMDLWGLGVVLYQMLTGELPFVGPTSAALLHQILNAPLRTGAFDPAIRSLLERLLAKGSSDRFKSAADATSAIEEALRRLGGATQHIPITRAHELETPRPRWRKRLAVCVIAIAALGAFGWWSKAESTPRENARRVPISTPAPAELPSFAAAVRDAPDPPSESPPPLAVEAEAPSSSLPSQAPHQLAPAALTTNRRSSRGRTQSRMSPVEVTTERAPTAASAVAPSWSGGIIESP